MCRALLQSEVADVIWRFDEPAARSVFRLAFDAVRQAAPNDRSSIDANAKKESAKQSRRWTSAIKTILKRYGLHDRQGAEAWLNEFEELPGLVGQIYSSPGARWEEVY